jgi:DNA helicase-2/ATP-dependent DNA helicase PcrA
MPWQGARGAIWYNPAVMALDPRLLSVLNEPQRRAVTHGEGPLLILAGAGSGKTRVITCRIAHLLSEGASPASILAVTFTNKAAAEMRKRVDELTGGKGRGVWVSTFHSFGAQFLRAESRVIGLDPNFVIYDDNDQTQLIKECLREMSLDEKKVKPNQVIGVISRAKDDLLDAGSYAIHALAQNDPFRRTAADIYNRYNKKMLAANALDFGDLILRTVFALRDHAVLREKYQRRFRHILVDEYQDTNHAQYMLTKHLLAPPKNLVVVGDDDQCLPPSAWVATPSGKKPISEIRKGDLVLAGTGWGKLAPMPVEKVMVKPYRGDLLTIRLRSGKALSCTPNHICFGRLVPQKGLHYVYLMWKKGMGYRVGTTGGVRAGNKNRVANGLMIRTNQEVADAMWIIHAGKDASEARFLEHYYSVTYGLPTMVFHVRGRRMAMGQEWINKLFHEVDTEEAALRLMTAFQLDRRYPHHRPSAVIRGQSHRKIVWFTVFGDNRTFLSRPWHDHRVQLVTSDGVIRGEAERRFPVRAGQRGTWRIETARKSYDEGLKLAKDICSLNGLEVVGRARLTDEDSFFFMPASHFRPGMAVPVMEGGEIKEDVVESVKKSPYDGLVYDLSVPEVRNFVAEGVVVHNSVYSWRGADIRNIMEFEKDYPGAAVVKLEQNYRSTDAILEAARRVIKHNRFRKDKTLWTAHQGGDAVEFREFTDEQEEARWVAGRTGALAGEGAFGREDVAVFYRTNAQSRVLEDAFRRDNIPYRLVGATRFYDRMEVKDVLAYLRMVVNPADSLALKRIINVPARGLGKTTLQGLENDAALRGLSLWDTVLAAAASPDLPATAKGNLRKFTATMGALFRQAAGAPAAPVVRAVLETTGYWAHWEEQTDADPEAAARLDNLQELVNAAQDFEASSEDKSVGAFLERVSLAAAWDQVKEEGGAVTLMTVHLAKGLEFPVVFLTGMEEGLFPIGESAFDEKELEEERRLAYVGITRARQRLTLTSASSRKLYGRSQWNVPSRFVTEAGLAPAEATTASPPASERPVSSFDPDEAPPSLGGRRPLRTGQRVKHPLFGSGRVLDKSGAGENTKVIVMFDSGARKTLLARYANFEEESPCR